MKLLIRKWGLCLMLMAATTLIYLDRQAVSILAANIQADLKMNNQDLGWVFSVFYYSYTLAQFAVGPFLDRYSLRWLYGGAIVLWAAISTLTGLATSFAMLLGVRILLGLAESGNWPGAMRIVSRALPPGERALGNGIFTSGTSVGALIAPVVILGASSAFGWRASFAALGALGLVWFAAWILFTRSPQLAPVWKRQEHEAAPAAGFGGYAAVFTMPQFWKVFAITIMVNPVLYFFLNWLPTYYRQQHGIVQGPQLAGILTATFLGLDLGYLFCGATVMALIKRGWTLRAARRAVMTVASVLLAGTAAVPLVHDIGAVISLLIAADFAIGLWIAMYLTLAQEVSPQSVSTAAGLLGGSGSLAGAMLMWLIGKVTQASGNFALPLFGVAVMALIAVVAGWAASRRDPAAQV
ncbi:MAG: MFS transporter [Bryobacterales bacterium]|nr:MFS transporter [Bryobacterales bacterium]